MTALACNRTAKRNCGETHLVWPPFRIVLVIPVLLSLSQSQTGRTTSGFMVCVLHPALHIFWPVQHIPGFFIFVLFWAFCCCFGLFWLVCFSFIVVSGWVQPHLMPLKLASHWQPFRPSAPVPARAWCASASRSEGAVIDGRAGGSGWYGQELTVLNWSWGAESWGAADRNQESAEWLCSWERTDPALSWSGKFNQKGFCCFKLQAGGSRQMWRGLPPPEITARATRSDREH